MLNAITVTLATSIVIISGTLLIKSSKICHSHEGNDELSILSIIRFICDPKQQHMLSAGSQFNKEWTFCTNEGTELKMYFLLKTSHTAEELSVKQDSVPNPTAQPILICKFKFAVSYPMLRKGYSCTTDLKLVVQ